MDKAALQCGYCTPGFILSAYALLKKDALPDQATIRHWFHGNICRCTGYAAIIDAVETAAKSLSQEEGGK
jgi:carbon-monoxide dehydrogenase small subunit